jgi:TrmH family RNA methyltransferase
LRELGGKDDETPELVAVGRLLPDDLGRVDLGRARRCSSFDRPTSPETWERSSAVPTRSA